MLQQHFKIHVQSSISLPPGEGIVIHSSWVLWIAESEQLCEVFL